MHNKLERMLQDLVETHLRGLSRYLLEERKKAKKKKKLEHTMFNVPAEIRAP